MQKGFIMDNTQEYKALEFTSYKDVNGFERSITLRGDSGIEVIGKMDKAIEYIKSKGGAPLPKYQHKEFPKKALNYVEGRVCPNDGARLITEITKAGKKLTKCENNKWNFQLRKAEGCTFTEWEKPFEKPLPVVDYGEPEDSFPY